MSEAESSNIQNHLTIDFPIRGPASAKALTEELPPLMPDLAKAQDDLGTVHFSRFMVKGDEKLLFLADIDGEVDTHIERLVASAGPVFDAIFTHVEDPPATPVASNPAEGHPMAEAAYPRASRYVFRIRGRFGSGHQGGRACGGLYGPYLAEPLADILDVQVTSASLCREAGRGGPGGREGQMKGRMLLGRCMSPILCPLRTTT